VPELALEYFSKDGPVLECGPIFGSFTEYLQKHGFTDIHVLDFVNLLRFPDPKKLTFHEIDFNMELIPYNNSFFNGAAAWGIGEHLENPFHFIREVHRVLKPSGIFLFSVPNVFHIVSRLLFLKKGMFPRWNESNNHISILPRGVFEKTVLRYFDLVDTRYVKPSVELRFFRRFSYPANQCFGNYVVYVLRARK
jgi:SAM-dependent methyltransferase